MNLKILLLRFKLKTYFATRRGILRGLAPLGEGVAEDTTKRQRLVAEARGLRNEHVGAKFPARLSPIAKSSGAGFPGFEPHFSTLLPFRFRYS